MQSCLLVGEDKHDPSAKDKFFCLDLLCDEAPSEVSLFVNALRF